MLFKTFPEIMLGMSGLALEYLPHTELFIKYSQQILLKDQLQVMSHRIKVRLDGGYVSHQNMMVGKF